MPFHLQYLFCILLYLPISLNAQDKILRVALASSLIPAMEEIKTSFESQYDIQIELIPGASGTLTNQILHGAPYDVFISANKKYGDLLHQKGFLSEAPKDFIKGVLVVWTDQPIGRLSNENHEGLTTFLLSAEVQTVAIAQPDLAPYGDAAQDFLIELKVLKNIRHKLIFGNNVSVTNQYIYTKSANVVITSLASQIRLASSVPNYWYPIQSNQNLIHTICRLKSNEKWTLNLEEFLLGSESSSIFEKYGYSK